MVKYHEYLYICYMRPQKVQEEQMLEGLMSVLRSKGYDGASLMELANAAGLKKASLYHRYPGGKKDMTSAVLTYMEEWIRDNIYKILTDQDKAMNIRLEEAIKSIRTIYNDGQEVCMYRSLSLDSGIALFGAQIREGINLWIESFKHFGMEKGMIEAKAINKANQTFIDIQGSLVLSKSMGLTKPFIDTLNRIKKRYDQ